MRDGLRASRGILALAFGAMIAADALAGGESPADRLLHLAPPDAAVTLVVEDLGGQIRTICDSPLAEGLSRLPAVRAWLASEGHRRLERARKDVEAALKVDAVVARDALLGDAFVMVLHLPAGEPPDRARGLLLTKVRDRALLTRLIEAINDSERKGGVLVDVSSKGRGEASYTVRTFRPDSKPAEAYAILGDVFAWSNSEALIQGVIDRREQAAGLGDLPAFRKARRGLPDRALASIFLDPRFAGRMLAAGQAPKTPQEDRIVGALREFLSTMEYAGAGLVWQDGPILHVHETYTREAPDRSPRPPGGPMPSAPPTALAVASGTIDFPAIYDGLMALVPEGDRGWAGHVEAVLSGMLLGKDVRADVLPKLGPGVLAYLDAPREGQDRPAWTLSFALADPEVAKALENGLRTAWSLYALTPENKDRPLGLDSRVVSGVPVTSLSGARFSFAFARGRFSCGATREAAVGGLTLKEGDKSQEFDRARSNYFPRAGAFAYLDLERASKIAAARREALIGRLAADRGGRVEDASRDLDQVLALAGLFRCAFAAAASDPGPSATHQTFGLIGRAASSPSPSP